MWFDLDEKEINVLCTCLDHMISQFAILGANRSLDKLMELRQKVQDQKDVNISVLEECRIPT